MIKDVLEGLATLVEPLSKLSRDRRELKDTALRAISHALDETYLYYRDVSDSRERDMEREALISKYWSAAAIPMRHFDEGLANICDHKSEYWVNPDKYDDKDIDELGIALDDVRQAYREMLKPR